MFKTPFVNEHGQTIIFDSVNDLRNMVFGLTKYLNEFDTGNAKYVEKPTTHCFKPGTSEEIIDEYLKQYAQG